MKTAIIFLFVMGCFFIGHSQNVVQLEEANISFPKIVLVKSGSAEPLLKIREAYANQFSENPIQFMKDNFDVNTFLTAMEDKKFDLFYVTFKSKKGNLTAVFNNLGELEKTSQKFKDIKLPIEMRKDILRDHQGWNVIKNSYTAWGKKDLIEQEVYRVSLQKGKSRKSIKIIPATAVRTTVASIK